MATTFAQTLTERQKGLAACACLMAQGSMERLEPGCRNNWHIHHKQVQVLVCVAGRGWMQHLTYHKDVQTGSSNEWLEPVTDEQYSSLK